MLYLALNCDLVYPTQPVSFSFSLLHGSSSHPISAFTGLKQCFHYIGLLGCAYGHVHLHAMAHVWGQEDKVHESGISFHIMGHRDQTQVIMLNSKRHYPWRHLTDLADLWTPVALHGLSDLRPLLCK